MRECLAVLHHSLSSFILADCPSSPIPAYARLSSPIPAYARLSPLIPIFVYPRLSSLIIAYAIPAYPRLCPSSPATSPPLEGFGEALALFNDLYDKETFTATVFDYRPVRPCTATVLGGDMGLRSADCRQDIHALQQPDERPVSTTDRESQYRRQCHPSAAEQRAFFGTD